MRSTACRCPAYREEEDVDPHSTTETFVAMKLSVDNWRWAGVPVYVRTGKRLAKRSTEVALQFQSVPHLAFGNRLSRDLRPDAMVLRIQPDEGITLELGVKVPGEAFRLRTVGMDFSYATAFPGPEADGYETAPPRRDDRGPHLVHPHRRGRSRLEDRRPVPDRLVRRRRTAQLLPGRLLGTARFRPAARSRAQALAEPVTRDAGEQPVSAALLPWGSPGTCASSTTSRPRSRAEVAVAFQSRPRPRFSLVCSGGPTARICYEELAHVDRYRVDWELVDVYMGDERCVPADDPEANQRLVRESLIERLGNVGSFQPMSCEKGPGPYEMLIKVAGELDLVHMGMGPDGHTASLFPGGPELHAGPEELVLLTSDPSGRNPYPRMTLSLGAFSRARLMVFTVAGADKRTALEAMVKGRHTARGAGDSARGPLARGPSCGG